MASIRAINRRLERIPEHERVRVLRRVARNVPAMFAGYAGGLYLMGRDRQLELLAGDGQDLMPMLCERAMMAGYHDVGEALLIPSSSVSGSLISAPMMENGVVLGVVVIGRERVEIDFVSADLDALEALADVLSQFIAPRSRPVRLADGTDGFERLSDDDLDEPSAVIRARDRAARAPMTASCALGELAAPQPRRRHALGTASDGMIGDPEPGDAHDLADQIHRVLDDLHMAHKVQRRFLGELPPRLPLVGSDGTPHSLRIASVYRPAFEVGGDFFDLIQTSDHRVIAVIGDVSGHGVPAALIMTRAMTELRGLARRDLGPSEILEQLNERLISDGHFDRFVTAACVEIDMELQSVRVANAGHIPPLLRRDGGKLFAVETESGPPLGLIPDESYVEAAYRFELGDIAVLVTDGISEALDRLPALTTRCRLSRTVMAAGHEPYEIVDSLLAAADVYGERLDDVALMALQLG